MHHTEVMEAVKSRREEAVDATRAALVDSALRLFTERGFAATSLDDVVRDARVTKGALYHHFKGGKLALFEAVFAEIDLRLAERIAAAVPPDAGPWELVEAGLDAYLEACSDETVRRIMFQEGPVALGYARWRELDGCSSRELLAGAVQGLLDAGLIQQPMELLTRLLFTTLGEAGHSVAEAEDEEAARAEARRLLLGLLGGLRVR
ncbi:MAG: TetR/AcrR family transcriptional regulator [Frankiales bacterium]|nr:MAG: TetR/AcrR family transcriptional regulator [Frankiales bacterium]